MRRADASTAWRTRRRHQRIIDRAHIEEMRLALSKDMLHARLAEIADSMR